MQQSFSYTIYIKATAEQVWQALTLGEITRKYWNNHRNASDWGLGSAWLHEDYDDPTVVDAEGIVLESEPPRRLGLTWAAADQGDLSSRVTFDLREDGGVVRLVLTHSELEPGSEMDKGVRQGWPVVLSSLKTLLETGDPLPEIWEREGKRWKQRRFATVG